MPTFPKTRWLLVLYLPALLTPITRGQSVAKVARQEAGLSSTALQQIDVLLQQAVERKQVAGAVALLARDGKRWADQKVWDIEDEQLLEVARLHLQQLTPSPATPAGSTKRST
jgi:hypothetical protein